MIAGLRGILEKINVSSLQINVAGIIYEVSIPYKTFEDLKDKKGAEIKIFVYHHINERGQKLFGFLNEQDKELFLLIRGLNGIGEMTALKILSFLNAGELYDIVVSGDVKKLEKIPKVKGKTSEKIIFEVKQNLKKFEAFLRETKNDYKPSRDDKIELSILALKQLGFDDKTAEKEVQRVIKENKLEDTAEIIKEVLRLT